MTLPGLPASRIVAAALACLAACRTIGAEADHPAIADRPAVIVNPTPESRAALQAAVRGALHGAPVSLGEEALTGSSALVVRGRGPPEGFTLVKNGADCVLVRDRTRERFTLPATRCEPTVAP